MILVTSFSKTSRSWCLATPGRLFSTRLRRLSTSVFRLSTTDCLCSSTCCIFCKYKKKQELYSKTCLKRPLSKRPKIGFQDLLSLNAGQREHSAILSTFIKLPFVIKIFFCLFLSGRLIQVLLYTYKKYSTHLSLVSFLWDICKWLTQIIHCI